MPDRPAESPGMTTAATPPLRTTTLGGELERRRLEVRIGRVEHVITALRDRERFYDRGEVPRALSAALRDFRVESDELRDRLRRTDRA